MEFAKLEELSQDIPYVALDLDYLRDESGTQRSFAYVVTYDTFVAPPPNRLGRPDGLPSLRSVVKLGDGGQDVGYGAGKASSSIISRVVRSYWAEPNTYSGVLRGVVIPGNDRNISAKIALKLGGKALQVKGDVWDKELLAMLSVDVLLAMLTPQVDESAVLRGRSGTQRWGRFSECRVRLADITETTSWTDMASQES